MWWILMATAGAAPWADLLDESGWVKAGSPTTTETGAIDLRTKTIAGLPCVRGEATVQVAPEKLQAVVTDIPSAKKWSSETLIASRELGRSGGSVDYYQHLDVPGWTMASDRYWVLRGTPSVNGTTHEFRWDRFDWKAAYPALATEISTKHSGSVEPATNYGAWSFTGKEGGTQVRYTICSDPGGSIPDWLKETAATKTLPATMADVVREGKKR